MVLKHSSDKITFIVDTIHSIGYETKGASIACHRLAYELANQGHYVYIFNEPFYPHENIECFPTLVLVVNIEYAPTKLPSPISILLSILRTVG